MHLASLVLLLSDQHQLHLWLEGVLVHREVSEERVQHEVTDFLGLHRRENEDAVGWSLTAVPQQDLLEHLDPVLDEHLLLDHCLEDEVHDGQQSTHFLVGVLLLRAEGVVDIVEVQDQLVDLVHFVSWLLLNGFESENLVQNSPLLAVGLGLSQVLGLVLVEGSVQEEIRHFQS